MAALAGYLQAVRREYDKQDGEQLRGLMELDGPRSGLAAAGEAARSRADLLQLCGRALQPPLDEVMANHCKALIAHGQANYVEAYEAVVTTMTLFLKVFRAADSPWVIAPLYALVFNLRAVAERADDDLRRQTKPLCKLSDAGSQLMRCFRECLTGAGHKGKKRVTLFIVNQLFKVYFKLNTLHLCKNLIKAVDSPQVIEFKLFSAAQRVTYTFFVGRLSVFDDDYLKAEEMLTYALEHCHKTATHNKRVILSYLIPVHMLRGKLPAPALLEKHNLQDFLPLVHAMKLGNVKLLNETLLAQQAKLISTGTYIILEKLKAAVYRTLFRKIHNTHKALEPGKPFQVPLGTLQTGLAWMGVEMDLDEVECILVNLIFRKYVKGYISHKSRVLVLSKQEPFPKLSSVLLNDPT